MNLITLSLFAAAHASFSAPIMSTRIDVSLAEGRDADAAAVFDEFRRVELLMSEWKDGSPLAAVNRAAGGPAVATPQELRDLLRRSREIGARTHGAFDVTWAALWGVWNFKSEPGVLPDTERLRAATALIDVRRLEIDDVAGTVRLPTAGMKLGLGGIAKGYALDRSAAILRSRGAASFLLSAGGQVYAGGSKEGRPWQVGVRDPRGGPEDFFAVVNVTDASVSTSGDYESFFVKDGVRYHHIIDPRTGMPSRGARAATVVCHDATLADALSTALVVMGPADGLALVDATPGVDALVVDAEGALHLSRGMRARTVILRAPKR